MVRERHDFVFLAIVAAYIAVKIDCHQKTPEQDATGKVSRCKDKSQNTCQKEKYPVGTGDEFEDALLWFQSRPILLIIIGTPTAMPGRLSASGSYRRYRTPKTMIINIF